MTKHQEHVTLVRARLNQTVKLVTHVPRRGGLTPYGTFAEKMAEIAKQKDVWPWKQKSLTTGGAPKDLATTLKAFAQGKMGLHEKTLRLVELTCLHYEMQRELEHKQAVGEAAGIPYTGTLGTDATRRVHWHANGGQIVGPLPIVREEAAQGATEDPEIAALYIFAIALDPLDADARKRVLQWAADKFGLEYALVRVQS